MLTPTIQRRRLSFSKTPAGRSSSASRSLTFGKTLVGQSSSSSHSFTFVQAPESSPSPHLESIAPLDTKECSSSIAVTIVEEDDKSRKCKFIFHVQPLTVDLEISPRRTKKDRRTPKKWTAEEEDALRAGVGVYKTKWASFLNDQRFAYVLHRRSNVDLNDKWRNLSKKVKADSSFGVKNYSNAHPLNEFHAQSPFDI